MLAQSFLTRRGGNTPWERISKIREGIARVGCDTPLGQSQANRDRHSGLPLGFADADAQDRAGEQAHGEECEIHDGRWLLHHGREQRREAEINRRTVVQADQHQEEQDRRNEDCLD